MHRAQEDDAAGIAPLPHMRGHGAGAEEHAFQVNVQGTVPLLLGQVEQGLRVGEPGVVDQDIDMAQGLNGLGDEGIELAHIARVDRADRREPARGAGGLLEPARPVRVTMVGRGKRRAVG